MVESWKVSELKGLRSCLDSIDEQLAKGRSKALKSVVSEFQSKTFACARTKTCLELQARL